MFLRLRAVRSLALTLLLPLFLLGGCATTNPQDPLEPMNRVIYKFNDGVDNVLIKPLAEGYRMVLPEFMRSSVSNFFSNINDILVALNNLLQGKIGHAASDLGRVVVNSTLGIGGLFDVATRFGLEKHNEDFGQTLGRWGVGDGPYLVLPFLGPSNLRDAVGRVVDAKADPVGYVKSVRLRNSLWGTRFVNQRAELLDTSKILETAALDPYEFVRDAYIQRRRNLIYDGSPPREKDEDVQAKPRMQRVQSTFPNSAEGEVQIFSAPLPTLELADPPASRNAHSDPERARDAQTTAPVIRLLPPLSVTHELPLPAKPADEPQTETQPPAAPSAAGAPAAEGTGVRLVRVWTAAD